MAFSDEKSIDVINGREHTISKWKVSGNVIDRQRPRMEAHPTNDDILYITYSDDSSNTGSRIFKLTMNSTRDGGTYEHVGEYKCPWPTLSSTRLVMYSYNYAADNPHSMFQSKRSRITSNLEIQDLNTFGLHHLNLFECVCEEPCRMHLPFSQYAIAVRGSML